MNTRSVVWEMVILMAVAVIILPWAGDWWLDSHADSPRGFETPTPTPITSKASTSTAPPTSTAAPDPTTVPTSQTIDLPGPGGEAKADSNDQTPPPTSESDGTILQSESGGVTQSSTEEPRIIPLEKMSTSGNSGDVSAENQVVDLPLDQWTGGWFRSDSGYLGRPWRGVYGAQSGYGEMRTSFALVGVNQNQPFELTMEALDDQEPGTIRIEIVVNDQVIFSGPNTFPSWDGATTDDTVWASGVVQIPAGVLHDGNNTIVIRNLEPSPNFSAPPFWILSSARISGPIGD